MADIWNAARKPDRANYCISQQKRPSVPIMGTDGLVLVSPKLKPQTVAHSVCDFSKLHGYWFAATTTIGYLIKRFLSILLSLTLLLKGPPVVNTYTSYSIIPKNPQK